MRRLISRVALLGAVVCTLQIAGQGSAFAVSEGTRTSAVAYADRWSSNPPTQTRNPNYSSYGADCTNFASQILHSAGWSYRGTVHDGYHWFPGIQPWEVVSPFITAWQGLNRAGSLSALNKSAAYTPLPNGDIYAYNWGRGEGISHLSTEVGFGTRDSAYARDGQGDYIDQHTTDRHHSPWNYGYLHPDASINTATMQIYWLPINYAN